MSSRNQATEVKLKQELGVGSQPLFTRDEQRVLLQRRDDIDYLPRGLMAVIARDVGTSREYVRQVLYTDDTFTRFRSDKAYAIWTMLRSRVGDRADEVALMRSIVDALKNKQPVSIKVNSMTFRFIERRLAELNVKCKIDRDASTMPISYVLTAASS